MRKQMMYGEKCGICEQWKENGIHLYTLYICLDCEFEIIHTDPTEASYADYVQKLKKINQSTLFS